MRERVKPMKEPRKPNGDMIQPNDPTEARKQSASASNSARISQGRAARIVLGKKIERSKLKAGGPHHGYHVE